MNAIHRLILTGAIASTIASCTANDTSSTGPTTGETLTVFAAASLVDAFSEIGQAFEADHPGTTIEFNFASSSDLAAQIIEGAPTHVFASADTNNLDRVRNGSVPIADSRVFATNSLEIIVEPGNPMGITSLADLSNPDLVYITCDEAVPIGRYSAELLAREDVIVSPTSYEENVKGIVNKIVLGEADAGIVYRTDVIAAGSAAQGVSIADDMNVVVEYPLALIGQDPPEIARTFFDYVTTSPSARSILKSYGFEAP